MRSETIGWFAGRLPDGWFLGAPDVTYDRDEILVLGALAEPDLGADADDETRAAARRSRVEAVPGGDAAPSGWRSPTRPRSASAARSPGPSSARASATVFTSLGVPVMTRLRMDERPSSTPSSTRASPAVAARRSRGACAWSRSTRATGSAS